MAKEKSLGDLVRRQASLVNETLGHTRNAQQKMAEFKKTARNLAADLHRVSDDVHDHLIMAQSTDRMFAYINDAIMWLEHLAFDLEIGTGPLASGRLPSNLWPPKIIDHMLEVVHQQLPEGWDTTRDGKGRSVWAVYRDARVMTASDNGRLRLFVQIPVYDRTQKFTLYRVQHLPIRTSDVTAVTWPALPDYLAVAIDAQSFVELSRHEVDQCHGGNAEICHFHGGMAKRNRPLTCAMTLFLDDAQPETIKQQCRPKKIPWNGSQTVYLGNQQWALSDKVSTEITMACHTVKGRPTHHILRLPVSGVFKLQLGCTGHTAEWLFPASNIGISTFSDNNVDWTPRQNALPQWKEGPCRREEAPGGPQRQAKEETYTNADALIKQQRRLWKKSTNGCRLRP